MCTIIIHMLNLFQSLKCIIIFYSIYYCESCFMNSTVETLSYIDYIFKQEVKKNMWETTFYYS